MPGRIILGILIAGCGVVFAETETVAPEAAAVVTETAQAAEDKTAEEIEGLAKRASKIVTGGNELDLDTALRRALADNPSIQAVSERVEQTRQQVRQTWSAWFPQVDASWTYTRTDIADTTIEDAEEQLDQQAQLYERFGLDPDDVLDTEIPTRQKTYQLRLRATLLLFDGFAREFTVAMARYGRHEAQAAQREAWRQLLNGVARSYFGVQLARENIRITEADEAFNRRLLTEAKAARRVGLGSLSNVLNFEVAVRLSRTELLQAERDYELARIALATLMGIPEARLPEDTRVAELSSEKPEDMKNPDIDGLIDLALDLRPDVQQKEYSVKRAKAVQWQRYAAYSPKVALFASRDASRTGDGDFGGKDYNDSVGASVTLDLFTGGRRWWQVVEAKHARRQAEYEQSEAELTAVSDVRQAHTALGVAQEQLILQRTMAEYVEKNRDLVKKEYDAGKGSLALLNQAQRNLVQAQAALVLARVSLRQSWFGLYTATSETLTMYIADIEE